MACRNWQLKVGVAPAIINRARVKRPNTPKPVLDCSRLGFLTVSEGSCRLVEVRDQLRENFMCRNRAMHFAASQTRLAMLGVVLILGTACGHQDKSQAILPTLAAQSAENARAANDGTDRIEHDLL